MRRSSPTPSSTALGSARASRASTRSCPRAGSSNTRFFPGGAHEELRQDATVELQRCACSAKRLHCTARGRRQGPLPCGCWHVREQQAAAVGAVAAHRPARHEAGARRVSYNAGIRACEKGGQWQLALALMSVMWEANLEHDVISYVVGISVCESTGTNYSTHHALEGNVHDPPHPRNQG
ncbi:unnamed protein product [Prorocentrum cordatum]|uniref:Pentatricopeptide repeat-containing protein n=1 Tax=Prorocentrum cordatum TaxID=2364126 RepID=A0ABN9W7E3_9DINO|nr:unnamed protein product [Polarella glacialis]